MSERPWYRRYPSDFIAGTLRMSLEQKGAYSIVLDLIYDRGGAIPDDARFIAGACGCSVRKWNTIRQRLLELGKIVAGDGVISNFRAEKELEILAETSRERAESGRKGGEKNGETHDGKSKNKDLEQAELKLAGASPLPIPFKKEGATAFEGKGVQLDRNADEDLFKACESIAGAVPEYMQLKTFPAEVVAEAKARLHAPQTDVAQDTNEGEAA